MSRDDIIRMAREAGFYGIYSDEYVEGMERFAALVAAAEREECAKVVECEALQYAEPTWAYEILNDIRARGQG